MIISVLFIFISVDLTGCVELITFVRRLCREASDILHHRIESVLDDMALVQLSELSENEPITADKFTQLTEERVHSAALNLTK